jgi:hypothetical protein
MDGRFIGREAAITEFHEYTATSACRSKLTQAPLVRNGEHKPASNCVGRCFPSVSTGSSRFRYFDRGGKRHRCSRLSDGRNGQKRFPE